ncbi:MAG: hypothetical protein KGK35_07480, partial [Xanthomonadaceae bacterium]|nr:hypothetical protein [Xanthomonadaceae bacterium]
MTGSEATNAPLAVPRSTAGRRSKRRMFEHMDVRVRRGRRSASTAGQLSRHDVGETVMPGAVVLATFAVTKVARSRSERTRFSG